MGRSNTLSLSNHNSTPVLKHALVEMAADEDNQLIIAHGGGGAFGYGRLFELCGIAKVTHELLLNRSDAGYVNLICVLQIAADLFEILVNQGHFMVV
ncbi:MAG: hypothetical protein ABL974_15625, partial [Prosthecobacter sp.]